MTRAGTFWTLFPAEYGGAVYSHESGRWPCLTIGPPVLPTPDPESVDDGYSLQMRDYLMDRIDKATLCWRGKWRWVPPVLPSPDPLRIVVPEVIDYDRENPHFAEVFRFAESLPREVGETLQRSLEQIGNIATNYGTRGALYYDFAPYSFGWAAGSLVGGCIFHGPHDAGGDGGAPTYSVCLTRENGWRLHT